MTAITVQIMVNAPTHVLNTPEKTAMRHRNGDILAVYNTQHFATRTGNRWRWNEPISSPRSVFYHIRDLPDGLGALAEQRLTGMIRAASDVLRVRKYRLPPSLLPVPVQNALRDDREVTMSWGQFKSLCRKKVITVPLDAQQDEETTELVDGDLR